MSDPSNTECKNVWKSIHLLRNNYLRMGGDGEALREGPVAEVLGDRGPVGDGELERLQHGEGAGRGVVEHRPRAVLEHSHVDLRSEVSHGLID